MDIDMQIDGILREFKDTLFGDQVIEFNDEDRKKFDDLIEETRNKIMELYW